MAWRFSSLSYAVSHEHRHRSNHVTKHCVTELGLKLGALGRGASHFLDSLARWWCEKKAGAGMSIGVF